MLTYGTVACYYKTVERATKSKQYPKKKLTLNLKKNKETLETLQPKSMLTEETRIRVIRFFSNPMKPRHARDKDGCYCR